ncbi:biopolymer transporter ExbD [Helicobacter sp. 13S00401-1]|uniref:biopolymer transporter ExbD n=1 Tax=Helicobacter sp. 13S00401-1 TaxID=1905758 RepID=UPI000BA7AD67|nr:biopolymer transporter ExbD [Helicobacter sp. 13S00401-1]PAF50279.1 biopolymer transporter ExbD [Helicobacter sp. 13S00401-1]
MQDDLFEWDEKPELNITPLVDIMLVLLAILMVTTPSIVYKESINLPHGSKTQKANDTDMLVVRMDKNKKIYIGKDTYNFLSFPDNLALKSQNYDKTKQVYIRADKSIAYGDVVFLLKVLKDTGFSKVALVTSD